MMGLPLFVTLLLAISIGASTPTISASASSTNPPTLSSLQEVYVKGRSSNWKLLEPNGNSSFSQGIRTPSFADEVENQDIDLEFKIVSTSPLKFVATQVDPKTGTMEYVEITNGNWATLLPNSSHVLESQLSFPNINTTVKRGRDLVVFIQDNETRGGGLLGILRCVIYYYVKINDEFPNAQQNAEGGINCTHLSPEEQNDWKESFGSEIDPKLRNMLDNVQPLLEKNKPKNVSEACFDVGVDSDEDSIHIMVKGNLDSFQVDSNSPLNNHNLQQYYETIDDSDILPMAYELMDKTSDNYIEIPFTSTGGDASWLKLNGECGTKILNVANNRSNNLQYVINSNWNQPRDYIEINEVPLPNTTTAENKFIGFIACYDRIAFSKSAKFDVQCFNKDVSSGQKHTKLRSFTSCTLVELKMNEIFQDNAHSRPDVFPCSIRAMFMNGSKIEFPFNIPNRLKNNPENDGSYLTIILLIGIPMLLLLVYIFLLLLNKYQKPKKGTNDTEKVEYSVVSQT